MFARSFKLGNRAYSMVRAHNAPRSHRARWAIAASSTFAGFSLYVLTQKAVHNDASISKSLSIAKQRSEIDGLRPLVWGSNLNHLIAPDRDVTDCIKFPTYAPDLFSDALRDLAFSNSHAACVDAGGNVYQWGDGFFGSEFTGAKQPRLTLQGKDIVSLAMTPNKIFALSASGKIYALSSSLSRQSVEPSAHLFWAIFGLGNSQPLHDTLDTDVSLSWGERFTSISAGSDHLLALTSSGRTFAHPVTRSANWYGQLGFRKISIHDPIDPTKRLPVELLVKATRDGLRNGTKSIPDVYRSHVEPSDPADDEKVGFCNRLFEIPALRGIEVQQAVAGDRTSFVVTRRDGRVLGWGANEFGQLGLGGNVTLPSVTVPTEVVLSNFSPRGTRTRCMSIATGGDLTFFTVERELSVEGAGTVDVLACGNGQWGGLGNALYSSAQGTPSKVKNISGVLEYDEKTNSLKPLRPHYISVAPGSVNASPNPRASSSGHVIATLDTIPLSHPSPNTSEAAEAADSPGRDILAWGLNQSYQLGNRKRASESAPVPVQTSDGEGRLMCKVDRGKVKDFNGSVVGRKIRIEQRAVAGPGLSVIYWRLVR